MVSIYEDIDENFPGLSDGIVPVDFEDILPTDDDSNTCLQSIESWIHEFPIKEEIDDISFDLDNVMNQFTSDIPINRREWMMEDALTKRLRSPRLFEFLVLLLTNFHYESYASFTDRSKGIFQIHRPEKVAELWQAVKSRQSNQKMTYDKFARAIRWYYKSNIMQKTNTKYTFQFSTKTLRTYFVDENNNNRRLCIPA